MADFTETAASGEATRWWRRVYEQISDMKQRGILLPTDEQYLEAVRRKLGET